jgi:hypothetical protein
MKAFKLTPEQKRWGLTLCLVATVGFNLSHLVDQPVAGQSEFASTGDGNSPDTQKPAQTTSTDRREGGVNIDGKEYKAEYIKVGNDRVIVRLQDKDPNLSMGDGAACPDGSCYTAEYKADFNDVGDTKTRGSIELTKIKLRLQGNSSSQAKTATKEEEVDLSSIPVEKMSEKQKDKRADELLAKVEDTCGSKQKADQLRCYSRELKSLLKDSDNKKIISESKVADFVTDHVKGKLTAYLKTDNADPDLIERLHDSLPGKYSDARTAIVEGSKKAIADKADAVKSMREDVRTLSAQRAILAKNIENKNSYCYRDGYSMQDCAQQMRELDQEINEKMRSSEMTYNLLRKNLLLVKNENIAGVDTAIGSYGLEEEFKRQLIRNLDSLKRDLYTITDPTTPTEGSLPQRGRNRGQGQASGYNGTQRLVPGQRIPVPGSTTRGLPQTSSPFQSNPLPGSQTGSVGNGIPAAPALRTY